MFCVLNFIINFISILCKTQKDDCKIFKGVNYIKIHYHTKL